MTFVPPQFGKLHNQNRVFAGQTDQHHKTHLREDVDVHFRHGDSGQRTQHTHGHHQNHGEGQRPAFIQSRQHQEYESHGSGKQQHSRTAGRAFKKCQLSPLGSHGWRQFAGSQLFQRCDAFTAAETRRCVRRDRCCRIHVVASHHQRAANAPHGSNRAQRNHLPVTISHLQLLHILNAIPKFAVRLDHNLPRSAKQTEVIDITGTQISLQRAEHFSHRDAQRQTGIAIDIHEQLRGVDIEHTQQPAKLRQLAGLANQCVRLVLQPLQPQITTVLHHQFQPAGTSHSGNCRWRIDGDCRFGNLRSILFQQRLLNC